MQGVGNAVDTYLLALESHKWTTLPSAAARSRARTSSSDVPGTDAQRGVPAAAYQIFQCMLQLLLMFAAVAVV